MKEQRLLNALTRAVFVIETIVMLAGACLPREGLEEVKKNLTWLKKELEEGQL